MKWKLSTFKGLTNTKSTTMTMGMDELIKGFTTPWGNGFVSEKKALPLWSPTVFRNDRRSGANAQSIYFLVYDMDDGLTSFDTWRLFHEYSVIAHTSYSHTPQKHKYRIILPLAKPILADHWDRASKAAQELWDTVVDRGQPDQGALHDRARAFFRYGLPHPHQKGMMAHHPMHPRNFHQTAWHIGHPLELKYEHIPQDAPKKVIPKKPRTYSNGKANMSEVMETADFRRSLAGMAGGDIQGNEVRYIKCPQCGRKSVHYSIDLNQPNSTKWPSCNHLNKCAWWGKFQDII